MRHSDRTNPTTAPRFNERWRFGRARYILPIVLVGALAIIWTLGAGASAGTSHVVVAQAPPPPPPTCVACPAGYHCVHDPEGCEADEKSEEMTPAKLTPRVAMSFGQIGADHSGRIAPSYSRIAQNDNYVGCYKEVDSKQVRFRWCAKDKPWTATNETRNFCYVSSEACAEAEMPQSWCIKCEGQ